MKPPESFVPLTAAPVPPEPREFRVAILTDHPHPGPGGAPEKKAGFQSLPLQTSPAFAATGEKKIGEPRVSVQRDGDRVTHLRIQCSCGQVIDLACVYDAPTAPA